MASKSATTLEEDKFKEWYKKSEKRPILFMTVGRSGAGKSTLINTLLQLEGEERANAEYSGKSVTTDAKKYDKKRNGVNVHIIDTPGLAVVDRSEDKERTTVAQIIALTEGKVDVLLFCVAVSPSSKIDDTEVKVISALTKAFGSQIWEKAVLVLTFCNLIGPRGPFKGELKKIATEYAEQFNVALKKTKVNSISSKSIMDIEPGSSFDGIVAVPAGELPTDQLVHSENWIASLYLEILKKCDPAAVPQLLQLRGLLSPLMKTVAGGGAGAGVGACVGAFVLPGAGAIAGAAIGGGGAGVATLSQLYEEMWDIAATNIKVNEIKKKRKERIEYEKNLNAN